MIYVRYEKKMLSMVVAKSLDSLPKVWRDNFFYRRAREVRGDFYRFPAFLPVFAVK